MLEKIRKGRDDNPNSVEEKKHEDFDAKVALIDFISNPPSGTYFPYGVKSMPEEPTLLAGYFPHLNQVIFVTPSSEEETLRHLKAIESMRPPPPDEKCRLSPWHPIILNESEREAAERQQPSVVVVVRRETDDTFTTGYCCAPGHSETTALSLIREQAIVEQAKLYAKIIRQKRSI